MKKVSLAVALFAITAISAAAAPNQVAMSTNHSVTMFATPPTAVTQAFISIFGNVPVRQWKLRSNGNWRAHFLNNGIAWEATFTPAGVLVKSERD